ncbi:MAG: flippase [Desulfuromonas sp.]|nr:MAG: flippase [Desulfuromonas sp.]
MLQRLKRKITEFTSDSRFREILTGSVFALVARVGSTGLALLSSLIVARVYGAKMVGVLAVVQSFMILSGIFAILGTDQSIMRLIPEHAAKYSGLSAFKVYRKTQYLVAGASLTLGVPIFFFSEIIADKIFSKPHFAYYIGITSLCIIFKGLMDLNTQAVRGLRLIQTFAIMQVFPQVFMLIILLVMIVVSGKENDPFYAQLAAWGMTAVAGALIMDRAFKMRSNKTDHVEPLPLRSLLAISTPMMMTLSMNFLIGQSGVLILGIYLPENEVGYYAIAVKLATLTAFVLNAINSMAAPKFSELYHTGKMDELFHIARKSTKLIFVTTVPVLFCLAGFGRLILSFWGEEFTSAYPVLLILIVGQFVNSVSGSTGNFMNMTGHEKVFKNIIAVAGVLNLGLCFLLIPSYGVLGAAVSAALSLALWNLWTLCFIKKKFGKSIGYFPGVG